MRAGVCSRTSGVRRAFYASVLACVLLYSGYVLLSGLVTGKGMCMVKAQNRINSLPSHTGGGVYMRRNLTHEPLCARGAPGVETDGATCMPLEVFQMSFHEWCAYWRKAPLGGFNKHFTKEEGVIMQFVAEIAGLSTFMAMHNVRTYLEVGAYSGGFVAHLHAKFRFDKVAAVSLEPIPYLDHPKHKDIQVFVGSSRSQEYIEWRTALGHFDLVFIDGDHSYRGCLGDYHVELEQSHTFLAFHDIFSMWTLEEKTRRARAKGAALFQDVEYNYWSDKLINGKSPLRFPGVTKVWREHVKGLMKTEFINSANDGQFNTPQNKGIPQSAGIGVVYAPTAGRVSTPADPMGTS